MEPIADELPKEFVLQDSTDLLDVLDPAKQRINTFYLYDEFSEKLKLLREQKGKRSLQ